MNWWGGGAGGGWLISYCIYPPSGDGDVFCGDKCKFEVWISQEQQQQQEQQLSNILDLAKNFCEFKKRLSLDVIL